MSLDKSILNIQSISPPGGNPPLDFIEAARTWSNFIYNYSLSAQTDVASIKPTFPLQGQDLFSSFSVSLSKGSFLEDLPVSLVTFWTGSVWVLPNYVGTIVPIQAATLQSSLASLSARTNSDNPPRPEELVDIIDNFTRTIKVTVVQTTPTATTVSSIS